MRESFIVEHSRCIGTTPQIVSSIFGDIKLTRFGYRPMDRNEKLPLIFPIALSMGIVDGTTAAIRERVGRYQAETGATQKRTLKRLKEVHALSWGVKKSRQVGITENIAELMSEKRHEIQVKKLLDLLEKADENEGRNMPVLSVGRDGITLRGTVRDGSIYEFASAGTVSVIDRNGQRLGNVYLAHVPESNQGTMSEQLNKLINDVLMRWKNLLPRLCYVT